MWDLVPWPGIKPRPPVLGAQSLSHWTTREIPRWRLLVDVQTQSPGSCLSVYSYISQVTILPSQSLVQKQETSVDKHSVQVPVSYPHPNSTKFYKVRYLWCIFEQFIKQSSLVFATERAKGGWKLQNGVLWSYLLTLSKWQMDMHREKLLVSQQFSAKKTPECYFPSICVFNISSCVL